MIEAQYGEHEVTCFHNGQFRKCILHVVVTQNHGTKFFLFDTHGWAIDDLRAQGDARNQYTTGKAKEIKL